MHSIIFIGVEFENDANDFVYGYLDALHFHAKNNLLNGTDKSANRIYSKKILEANKSTITEGAKIFTLRS